MTPSGGSVALNKLMAVTLLHCSECDSAASGEAWNEAWRNERSRRMGDREAIAEHEWSTESTSMYGLDDRMVCPSCAFVHADNDCSAVAELEGFAVELPGQRDVA